MEFTELKQLILDRAKNNSACQPGFEAGLNSDTPEQLLEVIKDNAHWLFKETNTLTIEIMENFGKEFCHENGVYWNCEVSVSDKKCLALDNSTVEALDNSTVEAWDNSTVKAWGNSTVKAWDNSTVEAWGNSTVEALDNSTVKAWGNSTVKALDNSTVEALDNSTVEALDNSTVKAWDNSTVEAWGNSTVKAWGNSTVKALDNSTVEALDNSTVEALDNSTVTIPSYSLNKASNIKIDGDFATLKDVPARKIYVKKSNFEIIEL
jgi:hypothetical protein